MIVVFKFALLCVGLGFCARFGWDMAGALQAGMATIFKADQEG